MREAFKRDVPDADVRFVDTGHDQTMEPAQTRPRHEAIDHDGLLVHEWRVAQLTRLGIPWSLAQAAADHIDWHQVAQLVRRGCPPRLALQIVR
jgi:hypothetical protein